MIVYHGSLERVERPEIRAATHTLDYGAGFKVDQSNVRLLIPAKISWLAPWLAEDKGISLTDAIGCIYRSSLYRKLAQEETKYWHLGPVDLYRELRAEV